MSNILAHCCELFLKLTWTAWVCCVMFKLLPYRQNNLFFKLMIRIWKLYFQHQFVHICISNQNISVQLGANKRECGHASKGEIRLFWSSLSKQASTLSYFFRNNHSGFEVVFWIIWSSKFWKQTCPGRPQFYLTANVFAKTVTDVACFCLKFHSH